MIDWSKLLIRHGKNKDWEDKTCGCGFSIECRCGWFFTACMLLTSDGTEITDKVTDCPYCEK